ncbi:MAG TPA: HAMP domain-containing sensor histidine kinase [Chitinophaga sp.]|uniref:sensor histidine kinase n=1 Tax=Chitinophaga sp. TaxID=1869181 RepID=UPI002C4B08D9|nr:HAMP domain-containing sensor histidine kinase [Chitinophaga sp.]HVI46199.1 HAMP domain-containing sensor histidine kinase [Chitinophaga sp.]
MDSIPNEADVTMRPNVTIPIVDTIRPKHFIFNNDTLRVYTDGQLRSTLTHNSKELTDSALYSLLKKAMARNKIPVTFHLLHWTDNTLSVYPQHDLQKSFIDTSVSFLVGNDAHTRFQLHMHDLNYIAILRLWPLVGLSIVYLVILIGILRLLNRNIRDSRKLLELKRSFTYNITHELKTPVTTLAAATESLERYYSQHDPETIKDYLTIMREELSRMSDMIDNILLQQRIKDGKVTLRKQPVKLVTLISEVKNRLMITLNHHHATLDTSGIPSDLIADLDVNWMKDVFTNLIENAIKYADEDPMIFISASQTNGSIIISVKDNGIGIPEKYMDNVFESYFRVPEHELVVPNGHGLGLSYVKEIIQLHDGSITIDKKYKGGTCFIIEIPA